VNTYRNNGLVSIEMDGAKAAARIFCRSNLTAIVLDLMLPGEDGLSICHRKGARSNTRAILMLTARTDDGSGARPGDGCGRHTQASASTRVAGAYPRALLRRHENERKSRASAGVSAAVIDSAMREAWLGERALS
jgi:DNA-binding response OmpR family regulator